ncbi:hypothetical protein [Streptomyces sp. SID10815]|uniref:hypothetical protein n=1 Tax=Streptomyces sp. SID10815 TaxID=2706027 RepID=UPI0013CD25FB|nr:hypothetical protein [Streptomyces sp. SID10815]NEA50431.1 hypothetical protein [Streptomyces sp. SID10815]
MSELLCRDCDLEAYGVQPDGTFACSECGHRVEVRDLCFDDDEVWSVDEHGTVHRHLMPAACVKWMNDVASWPTGDWEKSQHALWSYRRATAELISSLRAGLSLPADMGLAD